MDGTLITNTNSVKYLCKINNNLDEVLEIEEKEDKNLISWIKADYQKANLIKGLHLNNVNKSFDKEIMLINNIDQTINHFKNQGLKTILITAGPIQVANVLKDRYNFDEVYGSNFEVEDNVFTGEIIEHLGDNGKLENLKSFCNKHNIKLNQCIAIGDSESDIKIFEKVKKSIAINYSKKLNGKANFYLETNDISEIIKLEKEF
jgi:phosphoserine phosphatase